MATPTVLTTASTFTCAHKGTVQADKSTRLTVRKTPVLLAKASGKTIEQCTIVDDPNHSIQHCGTVSSVTAGESSKLTVGGTSVLLSDLSGMTDGTPAPNNVLPPPKANQSRLRAAAKAGG